MGRITAVSFDLDGTLIRYERPPDEVLRACFEVLDQEPLFSVEEYYARYDEFAETCDSMDELRAECFAALAADNGYDRRLGRDVADVFSEERDQSNVELLPSAARVLDELGDEYRIAVVTNGARDAQRQKIDAVDLERWIDTVVIAGYDVAPKPDPAPIERAMRSLGVAPETAVHIGNSLETDVAGATAAGVDSVWIAAGKDPQGFEPTYTVNTIDGLSPPPWTDSSGDSR